MTLVKDLLVVDKNFSVHGDGKRIVQLSDRSFVVVTTNTTDKENRVYRLGYGETEWKLINTLTPYAQSAAVVSLGTTVYIVHVIHTGFYFFKLNGVTGAIEQQIDHVESNQIANTYGAMGALSFSIDVASNKLEAFWTSRNSSYPNSSNIRTANATIGADGNATWSAITQFTTTNVSGNDYYGTDNQSLGSGNIGITFRYSTSSSHTILYRERTGTSWGAAKEIYTSPNMQASSRMLYLSPEISGLGSGLKAIAWQGYDDNDKTTYYVRFVRSIDGGATWSAMQKLVRGTRVQLTADKNGTLFISYVDSDLLYYIKSTDNGSTWSAPVEKGVATVISVLQDTSLQIGDPITLKQDSTSVRFSGEWGALIDAVPGDLGTVTERENFLTYSIKPDGPMGEVVEKMNGNIIGTKSSTTGTGLISSLTKEQWDSIRFGKYADVTGKKNTFAIEMNSEKWEYTFDKRPAVDADIITAVKTVKDSQEVYLPAVKSELAAAIRSKGGTVNDTDGFETMASAVGGILGKKYATGTVLSSGTTTSGFTFVSTGSSSALYTITITGLAFTPSYVLVYKTQSEQTIYNNIEPSATWKVIYASSSSNIGFLSNTNIIVDSTQVRLPVNAGSSSYKWIAIE